ncbi:MAG: SLBB domain-containing protein, partial [Candidatus Tenebribacter davisii]|nr:SLBB domain-containing protein [Candidatus Tenebribacter davisii]
VNLERIIKNPECDDNFFLENDDKIFIYSIPKYHEDKLITIHGEVQFPGYYSIEETKTTLLEILEKCGGPTSQADLQNAFLQRKSKVDTLDMEFERLKQMLVEDMTVLEYEYFKTKSRELRGKFAIDFENLWNSKDKSSDIVLKNNDFIFIPDKSTTINVSGQVKNPGLINFVPGKNYLYYIEQAGGFAWNARKSKIRLIKSNTGEWLKPKKDTIVEVKDMIFIPEKLDVDYWKLTKDIMTISAQIATTIIVIQSITTN